MSLLAVLLDVILLVCALFLAHFLHATLNTHFGLFKQPPPFREYALLVYLVVPVWIGLGVLLGLHDFRGRNWTGPALVWGLIKLHAIGLILLSLILFAGQIVINRSLVGLFAASAFVLLLSFRILVLARLRYLYRTGQGQKRLLLVGEHMVALERFVSRASFENGPAEIVGCLSLAAPEDAVDGIRRLGAPEELEKILKEHAVDSVLFFPPYNQPHAGQRGLEVCLDLGIAAYFALDWAHRSDVSLRFLSQHDQAFAYYDKQVGRSGGMEFKSAVDFFLALMGVVLLAPVFVLVALACMAFQGRPVFFRQERVGLNGRRFTIMKFRTMKREADSSQLPVNDGAPIAPKNVDDSRVTGLGRFLRRTSLDEIPQLLNVLRGSMSLVGPRPLPVHEQQGIEGSARRRLSMRPGITGLWQVSGRSDLDFEQWMELDLYYVDNWSLGLDFKVMLRTFWAVLGGRGAR